MFSIMALKIGSKGDKISRKNCLGWRLASFFSRNFVILVADFEPKLKTWSRQIMFYTKNGTISMKAGTIAVQKNSWKTSMKIGKIKMKFGRIFFIQHSQYWTVHQHHFSINRLLVFLSVVPFDCAIFHWYWLKTLLLPCIIWIVPFFI